MKEKGEEKAGLRIAEFSIRHPVTVCMVLASFLVLGAISIGRIPLVLQPNVNFPFMEVYVPYRNASPAQVLETIAKPIEEALSTVPKVQRLSSNAGAQDAWIALEFGWGQDVDWLRAEVKEKLDQIRAQLPSDVQRINVQTWGTNDFPVIEGSVYSPMDLRNAQEFLEAKIKKPLQRVPGVAEVEIWGTQRREVDIYLRLDDIQRHGVDVSALFRRLNAANLDLSLGPVLDSGSRYNTLRRGTLATLDQIRAFPVNDKGVQLREVADIEYDVPRSDLGRHLNGRYAIGFGVRKTSQANTVDTVDRVRATIDELNRDPSLKGTQFQIWFDSGKEIVRSLVGLLEAGIVGSLLSVAVLFLFLRRLGATLAIAFAIPFSMIATVGFLYMFGKTLNVLSMMGLMLASGMLVDNAVVVMESIYQRLERGEERMKAALTGTQDVTVAVVAATLTSIIIFVPLVFGKETNYSVFLGDTGTSIMISLVCSLFVSLTLIPLGAARMLHVDAMSRPRWEQWLIAKTPAWWKRLPRFTDSYLRWVSWVLCHRFLVAAVLIPGVFYGSFLVLKKIPDNSPEAQDLQNLNIQYEFTENYHYKKIESDFVNPVEQFLLGANREKFKIKDVSSFYGNNRAQTRVYFDKEKLNLEELKDIRQKISKGLPVIPGANINLGRQEGAQAQTWLEVNLYGEDPEALMALAREARARLRRNPKFVEIHTDADRGQKEVQIRIDRVLARKYGISPQSVSDVLGIVLRGQQARGFRTGEGEVDIWMRLRPGDREDLRDLQAIGVGAGPDGRLIRLDQVARLEMTKTPGVIRRENRRTYTWLAANYSGEKRDEGKKEMEDAMKSLQYPQGYGWSFGFWTQREEQEDKEFLFNMLLALFMVYLVMASLFESLIHPFAIMLSLPFGLVGVAWMLYLTGTPFNIMSKIGLLVLVGVVVNNGIVLLDHVNRLREEGMERTEAILQGCRDRLRPILMTTATTVVGLIPLAAGDSGVFELRYFPLARTVMGGLISSTVLTLVVLPTYYTVFDDLARWAGRVWRDAGP
ncbi:MAG: efflux RND transporter permease subunit, partial [Bryobacteraceae bacterium]|nr:efflux RND transporter permease subunit [Bryobacteraceae bacterium]